MLRYLNQPESIFERICSSLVNVTFLNLAG